MSGLLLKGAIGAAVVIVIALLSRSRYFFVAGLVPLFPSLALIAHVIVGSERGALALRETAIFGLWSLLPYAVYLVVVIFLSERLALWHTLLLATAAWCGAAGVLLWGWQHFRAGA